MSDLNLDFDTGVKSVTMGSSSGDNISINQDDSGMDLSQSSMPKQTDPTLSVSDPVGIEFLAKVANSPTQSVENTPKSNREEFSFFKPSEEPKVEESSKKGKKKDKSSKGDKTSKEEKPEKKKAEQGSALNNFLEGTNHLNKFPKTSFL